MQAPPCPTRCNPSARRVAESGGPVRDELRWALGVSRQTLHSVLDKRSGLSAEWARPQGALLGNGAQLCVGVQLKFALWQA